MSSLEDLRRTLDAHAALAPDDLGMVHRAQIGAARVRRRRRVAIGAAVAAAVVAVSVLVPLTVRGQHRTPAVVTTRPPSVSPSVAPARPATRLTVGLAAGSGYVVSSHGSDRDRQRLSARRPGVRSGDFGGEVLAYDPGAFDPAPLLRGERVRVSGHDAWYVAKYRFPRLMVEGGTSPYLTPVVGWRTAAGEWVLVYQASGVHVERAHVLRLAAAVRLGPGRTARGPMRIRSVPDGLPVVSVQVADLEGGRLSASVGFGGRAQPPSEAAAAPGSSGSAELYVSASTSSGLIWPDMREALGRPTTTIHGHDAWYEVGRGLLNGPAEGSHLTVDTGSCILRIAVAHRESITYDEVRKLAEDTTVGSCDSPSGWTPMLP